MKSVKGRARLQCFEVWINRGKKLILNLDALTYAGNLQSLSDIEEHFGGKRYFFERASICDKERVHKIITDFKPDTIVKFAAESHVDRSIDGPLGIHRDERDGNSRDAHRSDGLL